MSKTNPEEKIFPDGMIPLGKEKFNFSCHSNIACYTKCCRNVDMILYPYDILQLKSKLNMRSDQFLEAHVMVVKGENPFFPTLMMKMNKNKHCPFLTDEGCSVYEMRPSACRMYPLERAVDRSVTKGRPSEFYFLTDHDYCLGHKEQDKWSVKEWLRDQKLIIHNSQSERWAEMDTLFRQNPFIGEGAAGPKQKIAFLVCYNIDGFRDYINQYKTLDGFKLTSARLKAIASDDEALLSFGYDWLQNILAGKPTLKLRKKR